MTGILWRARIGLISVVMCIAVALAVDTFIGTPWDWSTLAFFALATTAIALVLLDTTPRVYPPGYAGESQDLYIETVAREATGTVREYQPSLWTNELLLNLIPLVAAALLIGIVML